MGTSTKTGIIIFTRNLTGTSGKCLVGFFFLGYRKRLVPLIYMFEHLTCTLSKCQVHSLGYRTTVQYHFSIYQPNAWKTILTRQRKVLSVSVCLIVYITDVIIYLNYLQIYVWSDVMVGLCFLVQKIVIHVFKLCNALFCIWFANKEKKWCSISGPMAMPKKSIAM